MSALKTAGLPTPGLAFEYTDTDGFGTRIKFLFLGEGEHVSTNVNSENFYGPSIVTRTTSVSGMTENVDHYVDDPGVLNELARWITFVMEGKARLITDVLEPDAEYLEMLKVFRSIRSKEIEKGYDTCDFCGEDHHPGRGEG